MLTVTWVTDGAIGRRVPGSRDRTSGSSHTGRAARWYHAPGPRSFGACTGALGRRSSRGLAERSDVMPRYLSVHRYRAQRFQTVAELEIVAAELSRWATTQSIDIEIKASGLAADTHRYIMIA